MATREGTNGDDALIGTSGSDTINGRSGDDTLDGLAGDDTLNGDSGDDQLEGGPGEDALDGGIGEDWALYPDSAAGVTIDLSAPDANGYVNGTGGDAQGDKLKNIEHLWGSDHEDRLTGDGNDNALLGFDGDDRLHGGGGDDGLLGGAGTDMLDGGAGEDWAFYLFSAVGVTIDLSAPDANGYVNGMGGDAQGDKLKNIENLQGSEHADRLTGDGKDNRLRGDAGEDTLDGGAGEDYALYPDSAAGVTIDLSAPDTNGYVNGTGGDAQGDKLKNIEHLWGSEHGDHLTGDGNNNNLGGLGGDDTLNGNAGDDKLYGGAGADTLNGGPGDDYAYYTNSAVGVLVRLHAAHAVKYGDAEGDTLIDIEHLVGSEHNDILAGDGEDNILEGRNGDDVLYGGPAGGDDRMYGGNGDDRIFGGKGNDILTGGEGNDVLKGGPGEDVFIVDGDEMDVLYGGTEKDTFQFFPSNLGGGSIRDFSDGEDVIDLTEFTGINSMDDLDIISHGDNIRIELSGSDYLTTIILSDFDVSNLDNSDFLF